MNFIRGACGRRRVRKQSGLRAGGAGTSQRAEIYARKEDTSGAGAAPSIRNSSQFLRTSRRQGSASQGSKGRGGIVSVRNARSEGNKYEVDARPVRQASAASKASKRRKRVRGETPRGSEGAWEPPAGCRGEQDGRRVKNAYGRVRRMDDVGDTAARGCRALEKEDREPGGRSRRKIEDIEEILTCWTT